MTTANGLAERLLHAYRKHAAYYNKAIQIVENSDVSLDSEIWAHDLQHVLSQVAEVNRQMAADKLEWEQLGLTPEGELRSTLANVALTIRTLANLIDRRSEELLLRKQRLVPVLDDFIRHRQMLNSYSQFRSAN